MAAKKADRAADTSDLEREIDDPPSPGFGVARRVYRLYGLTEAEIWIVEGR